MAPGIGQLVFMYGKTV